MHIYPLGPAIDAACYPRWKHKYNKNTAMPGRILHARRTGSSAAIAIAEKIAVLPAEEASLIFCGSVCLGVSLGVASVVFLCC